MTATRRERDSLGEVEVPADHLWGAQTQRSALDRHQRVGGNRFDFGHDQAGFFALDQRPQRSAVGHRDDMRAVGDLLTGCVGVAIDGDHFDAESLQRDDHFLAELAGAQQHDAQCSRGIRGAEAHGGVRGCRWEWRRF